MFMGGVSGGPVPDIRWICEVCGRGSGVNPFEEDEDDGLDC